MKENSKVILVVPIIEITQISCSCVISICHAYNQQLTFLSKHTFFKKNFSLKAVQIE